MPEQNGGGGLAPVIPIFGARPREKAPVEVSAEDDGWFTADEDSETGSDTASETVRPERSPRSGTDRSGVRESGVRFSGASERASRSATPRSGAVRSGAVRSGAVRFVEEVDDRDDLRSSHSGGVQSSSGDSSGVGGSESGARGSRGFGSGGFGGRGGRASDSGGRDSGARDSGAEFSGDSAAEDAEKTLLRKLAARSLSEKESRAVLSQFALDPGEVDAMIAAFLDRGYLNDAHLAEQIAYSGRERKGQARRRIAQTLAERGIPRDVAEQALDELPDDESELALDFARTKVRSLGDRDRETALRRLLGQLARRGFAGSVAMAAARTALDEWEGGVEL